MEINIVRQVFILSALSSGILGLIINYFEPYLPVFLTRTYRYGKFNDSRDQFLVSKCEVPKRWFKHFYIFAAPASTMTLLLILRTYVYHRDVPEIIYHVLDILLGESRKPLVPAESTTLAALILTVQCWKRLYETHGVNVFSDKNINVTHYILGFVHYAGALVSIVGESRGFIKGSQATFIWQRVTYLWLVCTVVFLYLSYQQLRASKILGHLRRNTNGFVISDKYKIPKGHIFEYVSSPLQFTEILMYILLSILLWPASTFHYVTFWVMANQVACAVFNQQWYKRTFKDYPKSRKTIIPYIF